MLGLLFLACEGNLFFDNKPNSFALLSNLQLFYKNNTKNIFD